ncbi:MAG: hypothetical protein GYB68_13790 [Chloroflexi bacterium]|nr:hypothetical protein [Chloroflexota bacterium]
MEASQTSQMVAWLDEERRKDKALITKLEERNASQAAIIEDLGRRIQALEGQVSATNSRVLTVKTFDDTIARLRQEISGQIEQVGSRRSSVEQDMKKIREMDRDATARALEELREDIYARIDQTIAPRRTEEERLSRVAAELQAYADSLGRSIEEFERSLSFLEEQRRHDTRRLSDLSGEVIELNKRLESTTPKIELLEDLSRRNERSILEVTGANMELRQQQMDWIEQESLSAQKRERMMSDMTKRMENFTEDMTVYQRQIESWFEIQNTIKKQVDDFDRVADRVDRRLNEVSEVQRLSEERFRREWEEFLQDDQKRWRQFTLTNEEAWSENAKALEDILNQIAKMNDRIERISTATQHLLSTQQEAFGRLSTYYNEMRDQNDDNMNALPPLT